MKLIVFSDIHGNLEAFHIFKELLEKIEYDNLIFLGDVFGYYYEQEEIVSELKSMPNLLACLMGNHDRYFQNAFEHSKMEKEYIAKYGHSYDNVRKRYSEETYKTIAEYKNNYVFSVNGHKIGAFHGMPSNPLEGRLYPDNEITDSKQFDSFDYVLLGHTHCKMERKCNSTLIINPGSIGQPRDGKGHSFARLDTETGTVDFYRFSMDYRHLYERIDLEDPNLYKLKEVLERKEK